MSKLLALVFLAAVIAVASAQYLAYPGAYSGYSAYGRPALVSGYGAYSSPYAYSAGYGLGAGRLVYG